MVAPRRAVPKDEARRIAVNIAKLLETLWKAGGLAIAGKPERELSHFSTAAQSELFYTDSENDPAQIEKMLGAFKPPTPQRPCGTRAYKIPARPSWGLFHLRLASSPVSASV